MPARWRRREATHQEARPGSPASSRPGCVTAAGPSSAGSRTAVAMLLQRPRPVRCHPRGARAASKCVANCRPSTRVARHARRTGQTVDRRTSSRVRPVWRRRGALLAFDHQPAHLGSLVVLIRRDASASNPKGYRSRGACHHVKQINLARSDLNRVNNRTRVVLRDTSPETAIFYYNLFIGLVSVIPRG